MVGLLSKHEFLYYELQESPVYRYIAEKLHPSFNMDFHRLQFSSTLSSVILSDHFICITRLNYHTSNGLSLLSFPASRGLLSQAYKSLLQTYSFKMPFCNNKANDLIMSIPFLFAEGKFCRLCLLLRFYSFHEQTTLLSRKTRALF